MANENESLIRAAYDAYSRGDTSTILAAVDPQLEWTYLDRILADPQPHTCHGRDEFATVLKRQAERGLTSQLEEVIARGERVMVTVRTPGIDVYRLRPADDRSYDVLAVLEGRIVAIRACRDRMRR